MKILEEKKAIVDKTIEKYLPKKLDSRYIEWAFGKANYAYDKNALQKTLSDIVWDILDRGGKRWRPGLLLIVAEALGADPEKIKDFSVIVELAHNGSLLIDDIEDDSELRRGKPCIHKIFGVDAAINAGNFMYFLPTLVFTKNRNKFSEKILLRAHEIFSEEMTTIHLGQGMDIHWHKGKEDDVTEEQYLQMCAYKTGTLARMAARLGVALADGTEEQEERLGKVAESLGIGFQIQDDILNLTAESEKGTFTKDYIGSDISEGKRSLLVIHTLKEASEKDRDRLINILNMHTKDKALIKEAIDIIKKYNSIEYAKGLAKNIVKSAWDAAEPLLKESEAKQQLKMLIEFSTERKY